MTSEQYEKWANENDLFISKVHYRIIVKGIEMYILNSYKFKFLPRFFATKTKYYIQFGVNWLGWIFDFQWSR
jgi:hypothetical protein